MFLPGPTDTTPGSVGEEKGDVMTLPMRRTRGGRVHGVEPAAILRQDPFADMQELLNRISGLVQPTVETAVERPWMPVAETDETDDAYLVRLELPGIAPDEIEI